MKASVSFQSSKAHWNKFHIFWANSIVILRALLWLSGANHVAALFVEYVALSN